MKKVLVPGGVLLALAAVAVGIWLLWPKPKPNGHVVPQTEILWKEGKKYWEEKKYPEALDQFKKLLAMDAGHFEAQLSVAQILKDQGKADEAVVEYEKAIGLNKEDPRAYKDLTEIFWNEGKKYRAGKKYPEALDQFKKLLAMDAGHFEARLSIAQILKEEGKAEEAVPEYEKVIGLEKDDPRAYKDLGEIYERKQNAANALKYYQEYLLRAPAGQDTEDIRQKVGRLTVKPKPPDDPGKRDEIKKLEEKIRNGLVTAQNAYDKGNYQECLNQCLEVLKIDSNNAQAQKLNNLAREKLTEKLATAEISSLIDQYVQYLVNKSLAEFYRLNCTPQLYVEISKDAELISSLFENLKPVTSNKSVRWLGRDRAEATFAHRLVGTPKGAGTEQELSNGTMQWSLEKQGDSWKIAKILFQPMKKDS
ncbi:MAG: tetratricopeptide repeat protein [Candidatus Aminicenantes bacterium]|nr:tetratricopeptide repeat protein [Candidatus Aminicenantes bacterium]